MHTTFEFQFTPLREGRQTPLTQRRKPSKFQFTPLREGRRHSAGGNGNLLHFNSRPSARGDERFPVEVKQPLVISIHAPPRGATSRLYGAGCVGAISIHAPPRGATVLRATTSETEQFQFTPLREGRRAERVASAARGAISIHAPPRGATAYIRTTIWLRAISIHAPPRGATHELHNGNADEIFQFTPLREGRRSQHQATPPWG